MSRLNLPPLAAVRVLEAAARHVSFTRAASELGMTQAAVSYQVRQLEDRLGQPLFLRRPREVVLTALGRRLAGAASEALQLLARSFQAARDDVAGVLAVTCLHTFAARWLVPRLGSFQLAYPQLAVRLDASDRMVDFGAEPIDLGIRSGHGRWPGLEAHLLMPIGFVPVCTPGLLARLGQPASPADLLRLPLIGADDPWWQRWFTAAGAGDVDLSGQVRATFGTQQLEATAALAGLGVAIVTYVYFATEIVSGRLVMPFPLIVRDPSSYWVVHPSAGRPPAKVRAFRDWLLEATRPERDEGAA